MYKAFLRSVYLLSSFESFDIYCAQFNDLEPTATDLLVEMRRISHVGDTLIKQHSMCLKEMSKQKPYPETAVEIYENGRKTPHTEAQENIRALKANQKELQKIVQQLGIAISIKKQKQQRCCCFTYFQNSQEREIPE